MKSRGRESARIIFSSLLHVFQRVEALYSTLAIKTMKLPWDSKERRQGLKAGGMESRQRSADLYHTYYWTRLSKAFRAEHPLCAQCLKEGRYTPAEVVDHIKPYPICGDSGFYDRDNLQSLCQQCNIKKGNQDKKAIQEWKRTHIQSK